MTLRAYREGDELGMMFTPESEADYHEELVLNQKHLKYDETYTCVDEKGNVCGVGSFCWQGDKTYYVWALYDRDRGHKVLREWKKLIDFYVERGNILYTYSSINERQEKLHKFLGFDKDEIKGDKQVWVILGRRLAQS